MIYKPLSELKLTRPPTPPDVQSGQEVSVGRGFPSCLFPPHTLFCFQAPQLLYF